MTKTERQQKILDILAEDGEAGGCTANWKSGQACSDPNIDLFLCLDAWCDNCLRAYLAGAKIAGPEDDLSGYKSVPGKTVGHTAIAYTKNEPEVVDERENIHMLDSLLDSETRCGRLVLDSKHETDDWNEVTCPACLKHKPKERAK